MLPYRLRLRAAWPSLKLRNLFAAHKWRFQVGVFACLLLGAGLPAGAQTQTSTTLSIAPSSSVSAGTVVTLTATVLAQSTHVTRGTVIFCDASATYCEDIHIVGAAQLTNSGVASIKFRPGIGSHTFKAIFTGTQTYASSSSAAGAISVTGTYPTLTSLTVGGSSGNYNLTATVTGTGSATIAPTGTVSFIDSNNNNAVLGTGMLGAGKSSLALQNSGNFGTLPQGDVMGAVAAGDFNGDGIPDLAGCNSTSNSISILLGNGDGTFSAMPSSLQTGGEPYTIAVGDFNNDGVLDLAVMNGNSLAITIFLGNGDGTFTSASTPSSGPLEDFAIGDFNRDGNLDIAGIDTATNSVQILLGNGDGTFSAGAASPELGSEPSYMVAGDFNGDGIPDIAVANTASSSVMTFLGKGDGTFTLASTTVISGAEPAQFVEADFNGDGIQDLAVTSDLGVEILFGQGNGSFSAPTSYQFQGKNLVVEDFNGDGIPDLALQFASDGVEYASVYLGAGTGQFSEAASYSFDGSLTLGFVAADFNGDGIPDYAVTAPPPLGYGYSVISLLTVPQELAVATSSGALPIGSGTHQLLASYAGDSHYGPSQSSTVPVSAVFATSLALTLYPAIGPIYAGQTIELIATLSPYSEAGYPSTNGATIIFYNGSSVIGTSTLSNGVATFTTAPLIVDGEYDFTANYAGNSDFASATSAPEGAGAVPIPTSMSLTASPSAAAPGEVVSLTATLSPYMQGNLNTNGELVAFHNNSTLIGVAGLSNGVATLALPSLSVGNDPINASFGPDSYFAPATAAADVDVRQVTSLSLSANSTSVTHGQPVSFTASLSGVYGASGNGEAIVFSNNGTVIGEGIISAGVASLSTTALGAGTDSITAFYAGDADNSASTSSAVTVNVTQATPVIAFTASPNPVFASNPVTLTAVLSASSGIPTGSVSFYNGSTLLGQQSLVGGTAILSISTLAVGSDSLTAIYSGDANFVGVTSSAVTETIESLAIGTPAGGSTTATVSPGGQAQYTLSFSPPNGGSFPAAISLSVTGLPAGAVGTFSPPTIPSGSQATNVTLTVSVPSSNTARIDPRPSGRPNLPILWSLALLPFVACWRRRWGLRRNGLSLLVLGSVGTLTVTCLSSCGGAGSAKTSSVPPPQSYVLTVQATSGALTSTTTLTLTVEQ